MRSSSTRWSRRSFIQMATMAGAAVSLSGRESAASSVGKIEKPDLRVGASVIAAAFCPVYVGLEHTWKKEGLNATLINFRGDPELAQALIGDSVDIAIVPGDTIVSMVNAKSDGIGFYAGFTAADFAWAANPSIKSWDQLKGTSVVITSYGALTDQIARYMLRKRGLKPLEDVQIMAGGPPAGMYQLLKAGRVQSAILAPPFLAMARADGYNILGTQADSVGPQWPKEVFVARKKFIEENPNTLKALLRGHVSAIRLQNSDPAVAAAVLVSRLKITPEIARSTFELIKDTFDEKGHLPSKEGMAAFWSVMKETGKVTEPWPDSAILDDRFIRTFASWAP